jgi:ubiquinone biosynthesis protein
MQWRELLAKLNRGEMKIEFEHKGLDNFIIELDRASNRLSFSLIIAAIIIGSSLIIRIDKGPKLFDYPLLGIAGYVVAGLLGLWLVVAILRSGKL